MTGAGESSKERLPSVKMKQRTFKSPCVASVIDEMSTKQYAKESEKKIKWATNMCDQWRLSCMQSDDVPEKIRSVDPKSL